jgi:NAD(P)-dependent dehydrogenase (short-subunit alcohol dehydrogenase family)
VGRIRKPKTVVITGATAGVGRAAALEFARHGADVALLARDPDALHDTAQQVRAAGVRVLSIKVDVSDAQAVEADAESIESRLGPIDVWVNNAMVTAFAPVDAISHEDFARVTDIPYHGFVWGTMAALKRMIRSDHGVIVQVGSALAYRSIPLQSAYCGAKHAIRGFTDALRRHLHHRKSRVHVTMVQMPALNTPQFDWAENSMTHAPRPVAPIFQPEVAARGIWWAATHRRREVWVAGRHRSRRSSCTSGCPDCSTATLGVPASTRSRTGESLPADSHRTCGNLSARCTACMDASMRWLRRRARLSGSIRIARSRCWQPLRL